MKQYIKPSVRIYTIVWGSAIMQISDPLKLNNELRSVTFQLGKEHETFDEADNFPDNVNLWDEE